ncbi:hypothetical protein IMSHALPRED_005451 [Imshaugia aleurites]|uniref:DUF1917-domain-containing protein n=1 Tax=Imshaugia aleurites TaxID=172621 RepID=A0A8H3IB82_9LECA|nr:hypothetical protein IMSHALPRED_005451 [Imshaugia aleurites]
MPAMGDDGVEDAGGGYLSDDSSFYGDDHLRRELEDRAASSDLSRYWSTHDTELSVIASTAMAQASTSTPASKKAYNPYEGDSAGRQLSETVPSFLSRLPPLTTHVDNHGYWIYIADPHSKARPTDEDRAGFMERGREILEEFEGTRAGIEASMAGKAKSAIGRKLTPLRKQAEADLYAAAKEKGCTSGKWLLFPMADEVNRIWSLVATATAAGELGHAAKVATDDGSGNVAPRLICVYTEDFSDKRDVRRVLERLFNMGLVNRKGPMGEERGIYYKADGFTYLGIESKNDWGLKASLFYSKDVLAEEKGKA